MKNEMEREIEELRELEGDEEKLEALGLLENFGEE